VISDSSPWVFYFYQHVRWNVSSTSAGTQDSPGLFHSRIVPVTAINGMGCLYPVCGVAQDV
jgi:hypothetical protein